MMLSLKTNNTTHVLGFLSQYFTWLFKVQILPWKSKSHKCSRAPQNNSDDFKNKHESVVNYRVHYEHIYIHTQDSNLLFLCYF